MLFKRWKIFCLAVGLGVLLSCPVFAASTSTVDAPQKDLIELLCLMSRWRGSDFLAGVSAYNDFMAASSSKRFLKAGDKYSFPDAGEVQKENAAKLSAICASPDYDTALKNYQDLVAFEKSIEAGLRGIDDIIEKYFQAQVDTIKSKMSVSQKTNLKNFIAQERIKKERELERIAGQMSMAIEQNLKADLSGRKFVNHQEAEQYAVSMVEEWQVNLKGQLVALANRGNAELRQQAEAKIVDFLGKEADNFSTILKEAQLVRQNIADLQRGRNLDGAKYLTLVLEKKKNLIVTLLNKELQSYQSRNDSGSIVVAAQLKTAIETFSSKAKSAIAANDTEALRLAVEEAQGNWKAALLNAPGAGLASRDIGLICSSTPDFLKTAKGQAEPLIKKIHNTQNLISKKTIACRADKTRKGCSSFSDLANYLARLEKEAQDFLNAIASLEDNCKENSAGGAKENILKIVEAVKKSGTKLQSDWANWKNQWPQYQKAL